MKGKAYAAGTVLNALATGIGSAFAIDLKTTVKIELDPSLNCSVVVSNGKEERSIIADRVLSLFGYRGYVEVKSDIPRASGLGSSSAFVNALIVAVMKARAEELDAYRILTANARISLEAGISYTGAFDDASASLLGGFVVSDNIKMRLYRWDVSNALKLYAAVLFPEFGRGKVDWRKIREESQHVVKAARLVVEGKYCEAMKINTKYYCRQIGYPLKIAEIGWKNGFCCGLSGNGPTFVGFGKRSDVLNLAALWQEFGDVLIRKIPSEPAESVKMRDALFISP